MKIIITKQYKNYRIQIRAHNDREIRQGASQGFCYKILDSDNVAHWNSNYFNTLTESLDAARNRIFRADFN